MVPANAERRLFQALVLIASIVPILAGGAGVVRGSGMIHGVTAAAPDLDSHFRYLSGLLLGIGIAFDFAVLNLKREAGLYRVLSLIVIAGGLGRLFGFIEHGWPGGAHRLALVMELGVVPLLLLWRERIERLTR